MWKSQFYDAEEEESVRTYTNLLKVTQDDEDISTITSIDQVVMT